MNIFNWLKSRFTSRGKALSLYRRGMAMAKKHDHQGAIADYTTSIGMPDTPADVKAMVLYNRALMHVATGDDQKAVDDFNAILTMDEAPVNVKTMAKQKLVGMKSESASATSRDSRRLPNKIREPCSS
jgi:hypothetical protein